MKKYCKFKNYPYFCTVNQKQTDMSYEYHEIKDGRKLSEMTEQEQAYIHAEWDRLTARESINTPERVFSQKSNGRFFRATRCRNNIVSNGMYRGSLGGFWTIRYGDCRRWGFKKDPFGTYYPDAIEKFYSGLTLATGETVSIPATVHTKKEVLELAKRLGFEL